MTANGTSSPSVDDYAINQDGVFVAECERCGATTAVTVTSCWLNYCRPCLELTDPKYDLHPIDHWTGRRINPLSEWEIHEQTREER